MSPVELLGWALAAAIIWSVLVVGAFLVRWDVVEALQAGTGTTAAPGVSALVQWWRKRTRRPPSDPRNAKRPTP
ncbi:hypothetical protein [Nonomuraea gerenzanensis]|uniref:Uncharacterized protein n=1 Tax=Nonomuraea gerenzanensis TaxID=93944 RepID=A0A1M4DYQ9_9ACTN|nr:hypothetical protein [Nonomuraea gerenzanensis]UBU14029.1 hypothetical protein LCN96_03060 [Nonomuraea gerenzanensis]SBO91715.1 hypothetical protein BN4615_P1229 [Nonomuraea gerenzanensis]